MRQLAVSQQQSLPLVVKSSVSSLKLSSTLPLDAFSPRYTCRPSHECVAVWTPAAVKSIQAQTNQSTPIRPVFCQHGTPGWYWRAGLWALDHTMARLYSTLCRCHGLATSSLAIIIIIIIIIIIVLNDIIVINDIAVDLKQIARWSSIIISLIPLCQCANITVSQTFHWHQRLKLRCINASWEWTVTIAITDKCLPRTHTHTHMQLCRSIYLIQFVGSKTRQSNMCNKTNRAGQQGHWCH